MPPKSKSKNKNKQPVSNVVTNPSPPDSPPRPDSPPPKAHKSERGQPASAARGPPSFLVALPAWQALNIDWASVTPEDKVLLSTEVDVGTYILALF